MIKYFCTFAILSLVSATAVAFADAINITPEEEKIIAGAIGAHPQVQAQLNVIPTAIGTGACLLDRVEVRRREAKEYFGNAWLYYKCPALDGETVSFSANATVYKENGLWKAFVTSLWTSKK